MIEESEGKVKHTIVLAQSVKEVETKEEGLDLLKKLDLTMKVSRGSHFWSIQDDFDAIY